MGFNSGLKGLKQYREGKKGDHEGEEVEV